MHVDETNVLAVSRALHKASMANCNPPIEIGSREEYLFLGTAFPGEAGELCNEVKKVARDGMTEERLAKIKGEIADNYAYLLHLCDVFGLNMFDCFVQKTSELVNQRQPDWAVGLEHYMEGTHGA